MHKEVSLNTFTSKDTEGSLQHVHICDSLTKRDLLFTALSIKDDTDHSFIYFDEGIIYIRWKNRAGEIHVCGSGAYASSWLFLNTYNLEKLTLKSPSIELNAMLISDKVILNIPIRPIEVITHFSDYNTFKNKESGIYLIELSSEEILKSANFKKFNKYLSGVDDIHGLCLFYWDVSNNIGFVRYFTPWHGRDEDSVTGSIHQYLTPLINEKYNMCKQKWIQASKPGGIINTSVSDNNVSIYGRCSQATNQYSFDQ